MTSKLFTDLHLTHESAEIFQETLVPLQRLLDDSLPDSSQTGSFEYTFPALQMMFFHALKYPNQLAMGLLLGQHVNKNDEFDVQRTKIIDVIPLSHTNTISPTLIESGIAITQEYLNIAATLSDIPPNLPSTDFMAHFTNTMTLSVNRNIAQDIFICGIYLCPVSPPMISQKDLVVLSSDTTSHQYEITRDSIVHHNLRHLPHLIFPHLLDLALSHEKIFLTILDPLSLLVNSENLFNDSITGPKLSQTPIISPQLLPSLITYEMYQNDALAVSLEDLVTTKSPERLLFPNNNTNIDHFDDSFDDSSKLSHFARTPFKTRFDHTTWTDIVTLIKKKGYLGLIDYQDFFDS